jgi:hypothetical protein
MNKALTATLASAALFAFSAPAMAGTVMISGEIDGSEMTFDNPDTGAATLTPFDTFEITVSETGMYDFLSFYAGDPNADENLDGFLSIYETFPGTSLAFDDDYSAGGIPGLPDADCVGSNCSAFSVMLTAGVTYTLVQTSFTDVANSFGQPTGAYDITITGAGDITVVPLPAAAWLMFSGLAGLGFLRRK